MAARLEKEGPESPFQVHIEQSDSDLLDEYRPHEGRLMRKIDWRLLPILGALYAIALVDRVNVGLVYKLN